MKKGVHPMRLFAVLLFSLVWTLAASQNNITINVEAVAGSCNGAANGAIAVSAEDGVPPYAYAWSNGSTGSAIFNLAAGTYTVTVTDSVQNIATLEVLVPETDSLDVSLILSKAECPGVDDGVATVVVNPPVGNYNYEWNIPGSPNAPQIDGLAAGTLVCVTVTDPVSGCIGTVCGNISSHNQVSIGVLSSDASCNGPGDGSATATASQGTPPYTFVWTYPDNSTQTFVDSMSSTIDGLSQNVYTVSVTDSRGCTSISAASIGDSCSAEAAFDYDIVECDPDSNIVKLLLEDLTTLDDSTCSIVAWEWLVTWSNGFVEFDVQNPPVISLPALEQGLIKLVVTTSSGCVDTVGLPFQLPDVFPVDLSLTADTTACAGEPVNLEATGTPGNTYTWTPLDGLTINPGGASAVASADTTVSYIVIAENMGCKTRDTVTVTRPPLVEIDIPGDTLRTCEDTVTFNLTVDTLIAVTWYDENGNPIGTDITLTVPANDTSIYSMTAVDSFGCMYADTAVLIGLGATVDFDLTDDTTACIGDSITLVITGDPNTNYSWSPDDDLTISADGMSAVANPGSTTTYYVTAENGICDKTDSVTITRPPLVEIDIPGDTLKTCEDTVTFNLTVDTLIAVTWYDENGNPIGTDITLTVPANDTSIYSMTAVDSFGCMYADTAVLIGLGATVDFDLTDDTTACVGDSITLVITGDPNTNYSWSPDDDLTISADGMSAVANPDSTTTYYVTAENGICDKTDSVTITRPPVVEIDIPGDTLVTCEDSVTFNLAVDTLIAVTWFDENGNPIGTDISITLVANDTMTYSMMAVDSFGCTYADTAVLIGLSFMIDFDLTNDTTACPGDSITLVAMGTPGNSYTWSPLDGLIINPDSTSAIAYSDSTITYYVTAENMGCTETDSVTVTRPDPISIDIPGDTLTTCADSVTFNLTGNTATQVVWVDENGEVVGTEISLTVPANDTMLYAVTAIDSIGCEYMDTAILIGLGVDVDVIVPDPPSLCADSLLMLEAVNNNPGDTLTYNWSANDPAVEITDPTTATPKVKAPAGTWMITLIVENQHDCVDTIEVTIMLNGPDSLDGLIDIDLCDGLLVGFTNNSNYDGVWDFDNGQSSMANDTTILYDSAGTYTVTFTTDESCVEPFETEIEVLDTIPVIADFEAQLIECADSAVWQFNNTSFHVNPVTYNWTFNPAGLPASSNDENPIIVFFVEDSVAVTLIVEDINGCTDTISKWIEVHIVDDEIEDYDFCPGDTVALNPDFNSSYSYQWDSDPIDPGLATDEGNPMVAPDQTTTYFVTITNGNCEVLDTSVVTRNPAADVEAIPDTSLCGPDTVTIEAISANAVSYLWSDLPDFSSNIGDEQSIDVIAFPDGVYYVRITTEEGCIGEDSVIVDNNQVDIAFNPDYLLCEPATLQIEINNLDPADTLSYTWTPQLPGLPDPMVSPTATTTYTAVVENQHGCIDTAAITVTVAIIDVEIFVDGPVVRCTGDTIALTANASGGTEYEYFWEPGAFILPPEDSSSVLALPDEGMVTFEVIVTDIPTGCFASDTVTMDIVECRCDSPFVFVPTVFTPNGDGANDLLIARTTEVDKLHFMVYNRWGEQVYETEEINHTGWDGTLKGKTLPPDAYGWYLRVECEGIVREFKGDVTLMR